MLTIIGCGNTNRCDDGAGVYVAQRLNEYLASHVHPGVRVFDAGTNGMEVMFQARGCRRLIVVDANSSGSEPGTIFEVPGEELSNRPKPDLNLHSFRWDHALHAGKMIFKEQFPESVTVFLIEVESLDFGIELSDRVKAAAERVLEIIINRLDEGNE